MFEGATVIDGTGAPRYVADVTVEGERIARIERVPRAASGLVIQDGARTSVASGRVLRR